MTSCVKTLKDAISYNTTGDIYNDLLIGVTINTSPEKLKNIYDKAKLIGEETLVDLIFNIRCPKYGLGFKLPFYRMISFYLHEKMNLYNRFSNDPVSIKHLSKLNEIMYNIIMHGCWKDLLKILETYKELCENESELFKYPKNFESNYKELEKLIMFYMYTFIEHDTKLVNNIDIENNNKWIGSYCAKWMPNEKSYFDKSLNFVHKFTEYANWTKETYRKKISSIRKQLSIWESGNINETNLVKYSSKSLLRNIENLVEYAENDDINLNEVLKDIKIDKILPSDIINAYLHLDVKNMFLETLWFNKMISRFIVNKLTYNESFLFNKLSCFEKNILCIDINSLNNQADLYIPSIIYFLSITYSDKFAIFGKELSFHTLKSKTLFDRIHEMYDLVHSLKLNPVEIVNPQVIFDHYIFKNDIENFPETIVILSDENFSKPINDVKKIRKVRDDSDLENCSNDNLINEMYKASLNNFTHVEHIQAKLRRIGISKKLIFWKLTEKIDNSIISYPANSNNFKEVLEVSFINGPNIANLNTFL
jgi:DNA-binding ferritin-like protein (Dps family)